MSNIKINDVPQRIQYSAALNQTIFAVPFPFFQNNYVFVWVNGIQINQGAAPGQYIVAGAGSPSGGSITLVTPSINGDIISIEGIMPIDRTSIYSPTISNLTGSDLNGDFNREIVMMKQIETTQSFLQLQYAPWAIVSQDPSVTKDRYIPILLPGNIWRKNDADTFIEQVAMPASGAAPMNGEFIVQTASSELPNAIPLDVVASGLMFIQTGLGFAGVRSIIPVTNQTTVLNGDGSSGNPQVGIHDNVVLPGTAGMGIPSGTTAQRVIPAPPSIGMRFNTSLGLIEAYIGGAWVEIPSSSAGLFLPLAGGTMTGNINMAGNQILNAVFGTDTSAGNHKITNLSLPLIGTDVANKAYVDSVTGGKYFINPVYVAATTNFSSTYNNGAAGIGATLTGTVNGAATQDGKLLALADRVLFAFQTATLQNGIYTVTQVGDALNPPIYTRSSDYDEPSDIDPGDTVIVQQGNVYANAGFIQTSVVVTIGTDPITFTIYINPNVVTLNTTQTITGTKTFSGGLNLGTVTTGNLVNCTGYTVANLAGIGANVATFLATPSSANLLAALTTKTGTGLAVFNNGPTLIAPALGTPASGIMTNTTGGGGLRSFQIFTASSGTYTKPANITSIMVEVLGGGGGGGGALGGSGTLSSSGGGGSGGYAMTFIPSALATYSYTCGAGGNGGAAGANNGATGATSLFGGTLQATGGIGGITGPPQTIAAGNLGVVGGAGGTGSGGLLNCIGSPGFASYQNLGTAITGQGGSSLYGSGGRSILTAGVGNNAGNFGSGGSGASAVTVSFAGGNGSSGLIIVWEFS